MDLFLARVSYPPLDQLKKKEDSEFGSWWTSLGRLTPREKQLIASTCFQMLWWGSHLGCYG